MQCHSLGCLVWSDAAHGYTVLRVCWTTVLEGRTDEGGGVVAFWDNEETDETFDAVGDEVAAEFFGVFVLFDQVFWGFAVEVTFETLRETFSMFSGSAIP